MGILSGIKKYKKYKQVSETDHQLVSYWTSTDTVETNDGKDLSTFLDNVVLVDDDGEETDIPTVESNNLDNDIVEFISHDNDGEELHSDFSAMTLISGWKLSNLMERLTYTINNVKYLINILGTTDISPINDGTVTGAISTLDGSLKSQDVSALFTNAVDTYTYTVTNIMLNIYLARITVPGNTTLKNTWNTLLNTPADKTISIINSSYYYSSQSDNDGTFINVNHTGSSHIFRASCVNAITPSNPLVFEILFFMD